MKLSGGYVLLGTGDVEASGRCVRGGWFFAGRREIAVVAGRSSGLIERNAGDAIESEIVFL
jgi:hypothetical protein